MVCHLRGLLGQRTLELIYQEYVRFDGILCSQIEREIVYYI